MRNLFAAGVAALMACLGFSPAASAETPAAASWCAPPGSEGNGTMNVYIVPTSGDNVNQKAFDGSLWCAEFWMQTGSTFTRGSEPVCAEF